MLSQALIDELLHIASYAAPQEMCGLLFKGIEWGNRFYCCQNVAEMPTCEFLIAQSQYTLACMQMDEKPWALVHSHPGKGAGPSSKDCQLMDALQLAGQDLAMVIVGLDPVEIRCFKKLGDLYHLEWMWQHELSAV